MNANERKLAEKIEELEAKVAKLQAKTFYGSLFARVAKSGLKYEGGDAIINGKAYWVNMFENKTDNPDAAVHNLKFNEMSPAASKRAFEKRDEYLAEKAAKAS